MVYQCPTELPRSSVPSPDLVSRYGVFCFNNVLSTVAPLLTRKYVSLVARRGIYHIF